MLEKFFKGKSIGYYLVAGLTLFSIVLAIVFFVTYKNPNLDPIGHFSPMGNKATGLAPETIGIFLIAGIVVEAVVLFAPEFRFFHLAAIVMFGLAIYKDIIIMADFFAGIANNVMYNGGNVNLNMFFFVSLMVIEVAAIVASFLGFVKSNEEPEEEEE